MFLGRMGGVVGGEGKATFLIKYREMTRDAHQQALRMSPFQHLPKYRQPTNPNQLTVLAGWMIAQAGQSIAEIQLSQLWRSVEQ